MRNSVVTDAVLFAGERSASVRWNRRLARLVADAAIDRYRPVYAGDVRAGEVTSARSSWEYSTSELASQWLKDRRIRRKYGIVVPTSLILLWILSAVVSWVIWRLLDRLITDKSFGQTLESLRG